MCMYVCIVCMHGVSYVLEPHDVVHMMLVTQTLDVLKEFAQVCVGCVCVYVWCVYVWCVFMFCTCMMWCI